MSENDKKHATDAGSAPGSEPSTLLAAANEQLIISALRQHELTEEAEKLNELLKAEIAERQAGERVLAERARLLDLSNDSIIVRDVRNLITYWNHGAEQLFGWTREEALGQDLHALLKTEFEHPFEELIAKLRREDEMSGEIVQIARDGRRLNLFCRWCLDHDAEGAPGSILTTSTETTERKRAEAVLQATQMRLTSILESITDGFHLVDAGGRFTQFNAAARKIFAAQGVDADALVGQHVFDKALPGTREAESGKALLRAMAERLPTSIVTFYEPWQRWFHARHYPTPDGGVATFFQDITERHEAEEALRDSEERFRALADNIPQLAWMTDAAGWIFWYNQRWFDYTGMPLEEMQGWGWKKVNHPDHLPRIMDQWKQSLRSGTSFEDTFPLLGADGQYRWFLTRAVPIRDAAGEVQRWFGTNTDVTDQRAASEALTLAKEQSEAASRAKDGFLAALSHELRTPLTPVLMMASAMASDPELPAELREQLGMIRRNIELEARLIDDLLDITRISRGKFGIAPVPTDLHELIQHTAEIVRSDGLNKQVRTVFILEAERHHALADPPRLQQVIWNLIKNALKFTPIGGTITVSTRNDVESWIVISVEDTGIGISAAALPHVFKAFEQGDIVGQHRYGGLGLGLAISHAIVEIHGGVLRAESRGVGLGATFSVSLGTVDAPTATAPAASRLPAPRRSLRLLIVEDHEATRTVLARLLSRDGHTVTAAGTVQEALLAFGAARFDLVVSDLGLPDGSGLDLMRELQRQRPVPAIALSGYGMEEDLRQTKEAGFFAHLVKPVNIEQLRELLHQLGPRPEEDTTKIGKKSDAP